MKNPLITWASRLKFPRLLLLTAVLFVVDLIVPDLIPFIDEILLGLTALVLASIKKRRGASASEPAQLAQSNPKVIDVEFTKGERRHGAVLQDPNVIDGEFSKAES